MGRRGEGVILYNHSNRMTEQRPKGTKNRRIEVHMSKSLYGVQEEETQPLYGGRWELSMVSCLSEKAG